MRGRAKDQKLDCAHAEGAESLPVEGIEPARTEGRELMVKPEPPGDGLSLEEECEVPVAARQIEASGISSAEESDGGLPGGGTAGALRPPGRSPPSPTGGRTA